MKALVGAFNQEKALVWAFSVIVKNDCETDGSSAAHVIAPPPRPAAAGGRACVQPPGAGGGGEGRGPGPLKSGYKNLQVCLTLG